MHTETDGVAVTVHRQPPTSSVAKQDDRHDNAVDRQWDRQHVIREFSPVMQAHVHGRCGQCHEAVVDVRRAEKIAGSPFVLQRAFWTPVVHHEQIFKQLALAATRAAQPQSTRRECPIGDFCQLTFLREAAKSDFPNSMTRSIAANAEKR